MDNNYAKGSYYDLKFDPRRGLGVFVREELGLQDGAQTTEQKTEHLPLIGWVLKVIDVEDGLPKTKVEPIFWYWLGVGAYDIDELIAEPWKLAFQGLRLD